MKVRLPFAFVILHNRLIVLIDHLITQHDQSIVQNWSNSHNIFAVLIATFVFVDFNSQQSAEGQCHDFDDMCIIAVSVLTNAETSCRETPSGLFLISQSRLPSAILWIVWINSVFDMDDIITN